MSGPIGHALTGLLAGSRSTSTIVCAGGVSATVTGHGSHGKFSGAWLVFTPLSVRRNTLFLVILVTVPTQSCSVTALLRRPRDWLVIRTRSRFGNQLPLYQPQYWHPAPAVGFLLPLLRLSAIIRCLLEPKVSQAVVSIRRQFLQP